MNSDQGLNSCITGNTKIFNTNNCYNEIQIDISTVSHNGVNIWGQVKDKSNNIIPFALVRLVKPKLASNNIGFEEVAHCISDSEGFYQFNIVAKLDESYQLLVSKNTSL